MIRITKNIFNKNLLLCSLFAFAGIAGFYLIYRASNIFRPVSFPLDQSFSRKIVFPSLKPQDITASIRSAINESFETKFAESSPGLLWWITDDEWNIVDLSAAEITIAIPSPSLCERQECVRHKTFIALNAVLTDAFLKNGFRLNERNSSKSIDDEQFDDHILAFEKEKTNCVLLTRPEIVIEAVGSDAVMHYSVACSDAIDERSAEQLPFLKALNEPALTAIPARITDRFALVRVLGRRGGLIAIAKKINSSWQIVFKGQEAPPCSLVEKYAIPFELYQSVFSVRCYDENTGEARL